MGILRDWGTLRRNQSAEELAGVVKEVKAGNCGQGHSQLLVNLMSAWAI